MTSTLSQLLFVYVLGGLTFIPLVLAAVLVPAWLALPKLEDGAQEPGKKADGHDNGDEEAKEKLQVPQEEQYSSDGEDGTASGTFAVLRKYDFPAANAALISRNSGPNAGGAGGGADSTVEGTGGSESVYQSMYRSVFDRSRTTTPPNALSHTPEDENTSNTESKHRRKTSRSTANVFYIVLRHGHLMLYDSPAQIEVRHVISLAHHSVSLSDGEDSAAEEPMTDGDLFIKRTAILLTPLSTIANGAMQPQAMAPKPFYLFTTACIQKESFYHALLLASPSPPIPQPLDPHDLIRLQTTLHSTIMSPETRALNAIISRIFLALSGTDQMKALFRAKIEKKISRVQKPGFINALALQAIELGAAAPVVANLRLKDLNISGDVTVSCDVRYTGGISLAFAAQARLDLGPRFKARTVDLLLASSLKRLSGHMLIRIKAPPSNRMWFCFDGMPDMEIKIEPVVSSRQITYGFILRQIEERIRGVVAETLVKPNWDDIPFFDTRSQKVRGGLWSREDDEQVREDDAPTEAEMLAKKGEKTMSMPVLPHMEAEAESTSSGTDTPRRDLEAELKRRSVASLPAQVSSTSQLPSIDVQERSPQTSRSLRSPSLTSPATSAPSVALDDSSANFDPSHKPPPQKARTWGRRQAPPPMSRKEAVDAVREVRDRSLHLRDAEAAANGSEASTERGLASEDDDSTFSGLTTPDRTGTGFSTASTASSASARTAGTASSIRSESMRQKKAVNLLAAATTAGTAAKNWGWNAIQNRTAKNAAGRRVSDAAATSTPQEPMGRGQPLPPPGMPLPGPQKEKSLWAGSGFGVPGLTGSVKRKPVLPRRPIEQVHEQLGDAGEENVADVVDEFGEWEENSGDRLSGSEQIVEKQDPMPVIEAKEKKVPPPLPKRRRAEDNPAVVRGEEQDSASTSATYALDAAKLATGTSTAKNSSHDLDDSTAETGEADLITISSHLQPSIPSSTGDSSTTQTSFPSPPALPARAADPAELTPHRSSPDSEDLVVVAAPVESGRNTPVPADSGAKEGRRALPRYDGEGWGQEEEYQGKDRVGERGGKGAEVEMEDGKEEAEDGLPKASFSRSRGDEGELHL